MHGEERSGEQRAAIVLEGLRRDRPIRTLCREHGITRGTYYRWRSTFILGGIARLEGGACCRHLTEALEASRRAHRRLQRERDRLHGENVLLRGRIALRLLDRTDRRALAPEQRLALMDLVRTSRLSVRRALKLLEVPRSTFYSWQRIAGGSARAWPGR